MKKLLFLFDTKWFAADVFSPSSTVLLKKIAVAFVPKGLRSLFGIRR